jgi:hypothetical protein
MVSLEHVLTGGLIKSEDWNKVIDELNSLETRVTSLEAEGPETPSEGAPAITGRSPTGDIVVPSRLTVFGHNFITPPDNQNTLSIAGLDFTHFVPGSDDSHLIVDLPSFGGSPPSSASLKVHNRNGTSNAITVAMHAPVIVPTGTTDVTKVPQNLGTIDEDKKYTFMFQVGASLENGPETYQVSATYLNSQGVSSGDWDDATRLVNDSGTEIPSSEVLVNTGNPAKVGVEVTVPHGATSVELAVHAESLHNDAQLSNTSNLITISVGDPYVDNANAPTFILDNYPTGPTIPIRKRTIGGVDVIEISFGKTAQISVEAGLRLAGRYTFSAAIDNPGTLWQLSPPAAPVDPPGVTVGSPQGETLAIGVKSNATAVTTELRDLVLTATKLAPGGSVDFSTQFRFPIGVFDMAHP